MGDACHDRPVTAADRFSVVEVRSAGELRAWLSAHHGQGEAVWLRTRRKAVPERYVTTDQVLDELVAFGWTDGRRRQVDDERTEQLVSPRRTQPWARSYKARAERLVDEGRMAPSGLASMQAARAGGGWDAHDDVDDLVVPDDLAAALASRPPAAEHFSGFPPSVRRNVLRWVASARTAPTREMRIGLTVEEAEQGRRVRSHG